MALHVEHARLEAQVERFARATSKGDWVGFPICLGAYNWKFMCTRCGGESHISRMEMVLDPLYSHRFRCKCDEAAEAEAAGRAYWGDYLEFLP